VVVNYEAIRQTHKFNDINSYSAAVNDLNFGVTSVAIVFVLLPRDAMKSAVS